MKSEMMVSDTGLAGKVVIVTGGGAVEDGISNVVDGGLTLIGPKR